MKYSSQDYAREDEGGGRNAVGNCRVHSLVTIRHNKRVKVEPLSPTSVLSDEELSMTSWSDEMSPDHGESVRTELTELQVKRVPELQPKAEPEDSESDTSERDSSSDGSEDENLEVDDVQQSSGATRNRTRIPTAPSVPIRLSLSADAAASTIITATTPPQTPPPPPASQAAETAIATNLGDEYDETNLGHYRHQNNDKISSTNEVIDQHHLDQRHSHRGYYRNSPGLALGRDRGEETRLSEEQREHLNLVIAAIKEGHQARLRELLEDSRRKYTRTLLNAFVRGNTALHHALLHGRGLSWCKLLVAHGADPTLTNLAGWHPIHLAAHNGTPDTMCYIISLSERPDR